MVEVKQEIIEVWEAVQEEVLVVREEVMAVVLEEIQTEVTGEVREAAV